MNDDLKSLFAYNRWADLRVLNVCRTLTPEQYVQELAPGWNSVRATLVHIAGATYLWSRRFAGESGPLTTEASVPAFADVERLFQEGHDAFDQLLNKLTPDDLMSIWSYRNIKGETYSVPIWSALRHVANHATYHRGQVASKLKRLGVEPAVTDFIYWAIEQTPQPGV